MREFFTISCYYKWNNLYYCNKVIISLYFILSASMKYKNRKRIWMISIILIIIVIIISYRIINHTNKPKEWNNHITLTISPSYSSGLFILSGYRQNIDNILIFSGEIKNYDYTNEEIFTSRVNVQYNTQSNKISSFIIYDILAQSGLQYAYRVFINQMIIPNLGKELIPNSQQQTTHTTKYSLRNTKYEWQTQHKTHNGFIQKIHIIITKKCSIRTIISTTKTCKLNGELSLNTPLSSGPIFWKIQGIIISSVLQ